MQFGHVDWISNFKQFLLIISQCLYFFTSVVEINQMDSQIYGPVLLVCIYNKYGSILTHDYFYQTFEQYGQIVKILIFEKAKVWKTFVQFGQTSAAKVAMMNLNNRVVFQDGSKMNIFSSKLPHIQFQNNNLGGVNYQQLKNEQINSIEDVPNIRNRRSTMEQSLNTINEPQSYTYNYARSNQSQNQLKGINEEQPSTFSFADPSDSHSLKNSKKSWNTFDIDGQFLELARESQQFRQLQKQEYIRRKSKTIVTNPNLEQFVLQNSPSKVLFIRSISEFHCNKSLYNIFQQFGNVQRVIYIKDKNSGLVQFQSLKDAIIGKDEMNYAKPSMKIFYSHYETLKLKQEDKSIDEDFKEYRSIINKGSSHSLSNKKINNPPRQTLYITHAHPGLEDQIKQHCKQIGCSIQNIQWKQNDKDKWMCLAKFQSIDKSLLAIGLLQGKILLNGKQLRLSFTRSKITTKQHIKYRQAQENSSM